MHVRSLENIVRSLDIFKFTDDPLKHLRSLDIDKVRGRSLENIVRSLDIIQVQR